MESLEESVDRPITCILVYTFFNVIDEVNKTLKNYYGKDIFVLFLLRPQETKT